MYTDATERATPRARQGGERTYGSIHSAVSASPPTYSPAATVTTPTCQLDRTPVVHAWARSIGLDPYSYGTHSMRRTKVALIYRQTKNLRAVQLLLGHTKLERRSYLGVEVDDALELAEQMEA